MNMLNILSANHQHVNVVTLSVLAFSSPQSSYHGCRLSLVSCYNELENKLHQTVFFDSFQKGLFPEKKSKGFDRMQLHGF